MPFDSPVIIREIDSSSTLETALSATLAITVSDATRIGPGNISGQLVVVNAGTIRFGQDGDNDLLEDHSNENSQGTEIDAVAKRRTVLLNLRLLQYVNDGRNLVNSGSFVGASSLAGLGNVGLTSGTDFLGKTNFGVAVDLSKTELTEPDAGNLTPEKNLWLSLDAFAEDDHNDEGSQVNRLGYQSWAIVRSNHP